MLNKLTYFFIQSSEKIKLIISGDIPLKPKCHSLPNKRKIHDVAFGVCSASSYPHLVFEKFLFTFFFSFINSYKS